MERCDGMTGTRSCMAAVAQSGSRFAGASYETMVLPTSTVTQTLTLAPTSTPTPTPMPTAIPQLLQVGSFYTFGHYEQGSKTRDGAEPIEWEVIGTSEDGAMLLSRYVLDCIPYNQSRGPITWETCTLRQWMNGQFFMEAFTDEEQSGILTVTLDNDSNPVYNTFGGGPTEDRIFALSVSEARKYLNENNRSTQATTYARAQGAVLRKENSKKTVYWWLRTPGDEQFRAAIVFPTTNEVDYQGNGIGALFSDGRSNNTGVRPALWISLSYLWEHSAGGQ